MWLERMKVVWLLFPLICLSAAAQVGNDYDGVRGGDGLSGAWFWIILFIAAVTAAIWWMSRAARPHGGRGTRPQG